MNSAKVTHFITFLFAMIRYLSGIIKINKIKREVKIKINRERQRNFKEIWIKLKSRSGEFDSVEKRRIKKESELKK